VIQSWLPEVVLIGPIVDVATLTGGWKGCDIHSLLAISPHPTLLFCRLNGRREEVTYRSPSHCLVCMCVCEFFCVLFFFPATSPVFVTFSSWSMDASCRLLYFIKKEGDFHLTHSSMRTSKAIAEWESRSILFMWNSFHSCTVSNQVLMPGLDRLWLKHCSSITGVDC